MSGDITLSKELVICPVLWKDKVLAFYSDHKNITDKEIELPASWGKIHEVHIYNLSIDGLNKTTTLKVNENRVRLDIRKSQALILSPN